MNRSSLLACTMVCAALLPACTTVELPPPSSSAMPTSSQCADLNAQAQPLALQVADSADELAWVRHARRAADQLACSVPFAYRGEGPILVATVVDLHTMKSDAQFGRVMAEVVANRLARLGYPVVEMRLRDAVTVQDKVGEVLLSRQVQELAKVHRTPLAIVGTYSESLSRTVVNLRAVRVTDGVVITAADFAVSNDADVINMLHTQAGVSKEAREAARPVQRREFKVRP